MMWSLGFTALRYHSRPLALAYGSGILCAFGLVRTGQAQAFAVSGLLLILLFGIWSLILSNEQKEQRHFLHLPLPLTRRQIAGGRIAATILIQCLSYVLAAIFLAIANPWEGQPWDKHQILLGLLNALLLLITLSSLLVEELYLRAAGSRWKLFTVISTYLIAVVAGSGFFAAFLMLTLSGGSEAEWRTDSTSRFVLDHALILMTAGYGLTAMFATLTIELFRRRKDANKLSNCWQGMDALWKSGK